MKDRLSFTWLKSRLSIALMLLALLPAMAVSLAAYRLMSDSIRSERMATMGRIAEAKHAQLVLLLTRVNARAASFLSHVAAQCMHPPARLNRACAANLVGAYLASEGASGATLLSGDHADLTLGASAIHGEADWAFQDGQLAKLAGLDSTRNDHYFVTASEPATRLRLAVTYPASNLLGIFDRPAELGASGETFLADAAGYFVTEAAYPAAQGHEHPISAAPMRACLGGSRRESIDLDYRGAEVVHGFRPVPEIGGGCIMAHIDRAETLGPLKAMEHRLAAIALVFGLPVMLAALYAARRISKTEASLRASENKFRLLFDLADDGLHVLDLQGRIVDVNRTSHERLGYAKAEMVGKNIRDFNAPESAAKIEPRVAELCEKGRAVVEAAHVRRDGSVMPVEVNARVVELDGERRIFAVVRDISESKRMDTALRLIQFALDNASITVAMMRVRDGRFIYVNDATCRSLGYSREEILAMSVFDTDPEITPRRWAELNAELRKGGARTFETMHRMRDGREYPADVTVCVAEVAGEEVHVGFAQDITQRKKAKEKLQKSAANLRAALDNLPYRTWIKDAESRYIIINKAYAAFLGLGHAREAVGKTDFDLHPRALAEKYRADDVQVMETRDQKHVEVEESQDGRATWLETFKAPIIDQEGNLLGTVGFERDITERRTMEAALRAAKFEAERANNAKSRFLAAASHDLRQPLTALKLYVGVLRNKLNAEDQALLMSMQDCIGGLGNLLSKLLDLSKLDAGVVTPRVRNFAIDDVLNKVLAAHGPEAEDKGLSLRHGCSCVIARTDPVLLQRIIGNIVSNAIRYTERGGVLIGCRRRQRKMWVEIWDTGIGIPADKTGEIFEEFKQLGDDARTYGSGLGLTIVARTASLLGLEIRVQSRVGRGSMFAIELPLGKQTYALTPAKPGGDPQKLRIAVVDDNAIVLNALAYGLESAGHEVVAAANGDDLLARLGARPPDILVCDYRLAAEQTGFDVLAAARTAFSMDIPAIMMTGDTDPRLMRSMAEKDVILLHKPVELEDLLERINDVMRQPGSGTE